MQNSIERKPITIKEKISRSFAFLILGFSIILMSCNKDSSGGFTAEFSYEFKDENHVNFTNLSEGEYYSLKWDFGNGETYSNTEKSKKYEIYYPEQGDYEVKLSLLDYSGNVKSSSQTVHISKTDLLLSFKAEVDPNQANYVKLSNTTVGDFDAFKWIYRNKVLENEDNVLVYFPFAGLFEIELQVKKGNNTFSAKKSVNISKDDPEFVSKFELSWSDEFDGPGINTDNWTFETGDNGWGNNELQNYTNGDNASIDNGILKLTARKVNNNTTTGSYTSTRINSKGKAEFTYGRMEIRAKLPSGKGIWPAIWMLGSNINTIGWPACGEIDILEYVGYEPNTIHSTIHTISGSGVNGNGSSKILSTAEEEFHVYGIIWTEKEIVFYTDSPNNVTHTYAPTSKNDENWPFYGPQFFILNVAVGGDWGGALGIDNNIFPQTMEIDYVRVFQSQE